MIKRREIIVLLCAITMASLSPAVSAQDRDSSVVSITNQIVTSVRMAYQRLDYNAAEVEAISALENYQQFSSEQLLELYVTLGLIRYAQNDTGSAEEYFLTALSLNPLLELDPILVSPKTLAFFEEVRSSRDIRDLGDPGIVPTSVRYVILNDQRISGSFRSMLVPGWGHLHLNRKKKGHWLLGAWTALVAGTVTTHLMRNKARSDYRRESDIDEVESRYDRFNSLNKIRNAFTLGAATVWIYSFIDILSSENTGDPAPRSLNFRFRARPQSMAFELRF